LPKAAFGKGFAEDLRGFAESLAPSAKQPAPVFYWFTDLLEQSNDLVRK
jgi:hypothetical protein